MARIKVADLRHIQKLINKEEISYSRGVEMLNEIAQRDDDRNNGVLWYWIEGEENKQNLLNIPNNRDFYILFQSGFSCLFSQSNLFPSDEIVAWREKEIEMPK